MDMKNKKAGFDQPFVFKVFCESNLLSSEYWNVNPQSNKCFG